MKHSKMKKAISLKGFLNSMSKKKAEMGMGMPPASKKITSAQSKNLGVAKGTPYKTTATPSDKINTVRSSYSTPPKSSAELNAYMLNKNKPSMKKGGLKPVDAEANPGLAKLPTEVRNKMGYMKKGGMSRIANEGFKNAKRTITDGYKGTGAPNPLASIVKNTAIKKATVQGLRETVIPTKKKPKMQIGGAFNTGLPAAIATEGKNFEKKESFQAGGSKVNQYNFIQWEREQARKNKPKPKATPGKPLVLKGKPNPPVNLPLPKGKKSKIVNF